jgi:hypothetical protein
MIEQLGGRSWHKADLFDDDADIRSHLAALGPAALAGPSDGHPDAFKLNLRSSPS